MSSLMWKLSRYITARFGQLSNAEDRSRFAEFLRPSTLPRIVHVTAMKRFVEESMPEDVKIDLVSKMIRHCKRSDVETFGKTDLGLLPPRIVLLGCSKFLVDNVNIINDSEWIDWHKGLDIWSKFVLKWSLMRSDRFGDDGWKVFTDSVQTFCRTKAYNKAVCEDLVVCLRGGDSHESTPEILRRLSQDVPEINLYWKGTVEYENRRREENRKREEKRKEAEKEANRRRSDDEANRRKNAAVASSYVQPEKKLAVIEIARSIEEVWKVFTDKSSWIAWWGGDLVNVDPRWQNGASITWGTGGGTSICDFIEKQRLGLKGSYGEKVIWTFKSHSERTIVGMEQDLIGSRLASVSTGRKAEFEENLRKLKEIVERKYQGASNVKLYAPDGFLIDLSRANNSPNNMAGLIARLRSSEVGVRKAACYESVQYGGDKIVSELIQVLERDSIPELNKNEDVFQSARKGAAFALGKLSDPSSIQPLLTALQNDSRWEVRNGTLIRQDHGPHTNPEIPVFGTSVRGGLLEADTNFAKAVLSQVRMQGTGASAYG